MRSITKVQLVLASASPRRQAFMRDLGYQFEVVVANIAEDMSDGEEPTELARRLATSKARAVAERLFGDGCARLIIAADTVVASGERVLGKPVNVDDARCMLVDLRNGQHDVHSGLSVLDTTSGCQETRVNSTIVTMRDYSDSEIEDYIATGDPFDKAGAYAIQHPVFAPVSRVDGCLSAVMGLPLVDLSSILASFGIAPPHSAVRVCEQHSDFACCIRDQVGATTSD